MSSKSKRQYETRLKKLRQKIDKVDRTLLKTLARRFQIVERVGALKRKSGVTIRQRSRWSELMRERIRLAKRLGLRASLVRLIFESIQEEAIACQTRAMRVSKARLPSSKTLIRNHKNKAHKSRVKRERNDK
jgi:chorismate mutase